MDGSIKTTRITHIMRVQEKEIKYYCKWFYLGLVQSFGNLKRKIQRQSSSFNLLNVQNSSHDYLYKSSILSDSWSKILLLEYFSLF